MSYFGGPDWRLNLGRWVQVGGGHMDFILLLWDGLRVLRRWEVWMDSSAYFHLISLSSFCVSQTAAAVEDQRPMFGHGHTFSFLFFHSESPNTWCPWGWKAWMQLLLSPLLTPHPTPHLPHWLTLQQERDQTALGQTDDPIGFINIFIGRIFVFFRKQKDIKQREICLLVLPSAGHWWLRCCSRTAGSQSRPCRRTSLAETLFAARQQRNRKRCEPTHWLDCHWDDECNWYGERLVIDPGRQSSVGNPRIPPTHPHVSVHRKKKSEKTFLGDWSLSTCISAENEKQNERE